MAEGIKGIMIKENHAALPEEWSNDEKAKATEFLDLLAHIIVEKTFEMAEWQKRFDDLYKILISTKRFSPKEEVQKELSRQFDLECAAMIKKYPSQEKEIRRYAITKLEEFE